MNYHDLFSHHDSISAQKQINSRLQEQNLMSLQNHAEEQKQFKKTYKLNVWVLIVSVASFIASVVSILVSALR